MFEIAIGWPPFTPPSRSVRRRRRVRAWEYGGRAQGELPEPAIDGCFGRLAALDELVAKGLAASLESRSPTISRRR
jgi:hypothetical protein